MADYSGVIAQLLTYGECKGYEPANWDDYAALGITSADVPGLIQMTTDAGLYAADGEAVEGWAPLHAWRSLAQLKAGTAVEPLLRTYEQFGDQNGWWELFSDELPEVFMVMGEAALPGLQNYLSNWTRSPEIVSSQITAIDGLEKIATAHPDLKPQCVDICTAELRHAAEHDPEVNGFLVGVLAYLQAVESADVIEQAFAGGYVEESIMGDWNDVQVKLGLKSPEEVPKRSFLSALDRESSYISSTASSFWGTTSRQPKSKRKAKTKQQTESRRKNRKKKKK